jgi:peptidyl-prolyl cis-trans isomerase C
MKTRTLLAVLPLVLAPACKPSKPSVASGQPAALVNGQSISKAALDSLQAEGNRANGASKAILDELVKRELLSQEISRNGLDPATEGRLENARRFVLAQTAIQQFVAKQQVSDADLKQAYDQEVVSDSVELHARHILLAQESDAKDVIARLGKGEDFAALASARSTDPSVRQNHGDLGWFKPGMMVKEFSTAALALKDGETSQTPVHSSFGWHVIRREGSRKVAPPAFDQVKDTLRNKIIENRLKQHIESLQAEAKVVKLAS